MRIDIQYLRHFDYGVRQNLEFEVSEECLVSELKVMIHSHIKVAASVQELYVQQFGRFEVMPDHLSLGFYQIKEGQKITLKVPSTGETNDAARTAPKNKQKQEQ
jgi:hypothetical protein|tara:strand:+ start:185 stop:496 length:312 start_codon:yes stop_codon:yes gene_type:complete